MCQYLYIKASITPDLQVNKKIRGNKPIEINIEVPTQHLLWLWEVIAGRPLAVGEGAGEANTHW